MTDIEDCISKQLDELNKNLNPFILEKLRVAGSWDTLEWQVLKRRLAEAVAKCIADVCGARVYLSDLHGGEFVYGELGDKDIDLIVVGCDKLDLPLIEKRVERIVYSFLHRLLNADPYVLLNVPNIVELHSDKELLGKKLLESRYSPLIRLA